MPSQTQNLLNLNLTIMPLLLFGEPSLHFKLPLARLKLKFSLKYQTNKQRNNKARTHLNSKIKRVTHNKPKRKSSMSERNKSKSKTDLEGSMILNKVKVLKNKTL